MTFSGIGGRPRKNLNRHYERTKKFTGSWKNILTKSYEDAISDVMAILNVYTDVGVYNVNLLPIISRIKALTPPPGDETQDN